MKRLGMTLAAAGALAAGCGGTKTITKTVTTPPPVTSPKAPAPAISQPAATCPEGKSFMGCSTSTSSLTPQLALTLPAGKRFPDVSNFQGHPNWSTAKGSIAGAAAKLGEGSNYFDADAAYNVGQFKSLHIPYVVYWFVRPSGCAAEGNAIKSAVSRVGGVSRIVLDEEVAGISGYAACLNPYVRAATGQDAEVYRSSGNNYDSSLSSLKCWVAAYGPGSPPTCSGRTRVAWQFTDGRYGFPVYIPGVGQGDVSIDYGGLLPSSAPADIGGAQHYENYPDNAPAKPNRERQSVMGWDSGNGSGRRCENPVRRPSCKTTRQHLLYDLGRDQTLYARDSSTLRNTLHLPGRIPGIVHRLTGNGVVNKWL